jgi:hypothetical protein
MGFELNRIMKQYGVGTPGMATYTGATAPSRELDTAYYAKMNPDLATAGLTTPEQLQKHYTESGKKEGRAAFDEAAFNEQMRKYGLDQKSYDTYKADYQNRLQNTPMYVQGQFDTGNRPVSDAMKHATNPTKNDATGQGMGVDKFYANTKQYIADNPYASTQAIRDQQAKIGMSNQDVYNATGSYYGNQLKNPTYGAMNASMVNDTPQAKSDYYLQQRNLGYTDADLRDATTSTFGKPAEGDWAQLTARAYPTYNQNIVDAYKSIGRSWDAGTIDAPGYNYWMNQLSTGAFNPKDLNSTFAKIAADEKAAADAKAVKMDVEKFSDAFAEDPTFKNLAYDSGPTLGVARGGSVHDLAAQYAIGGSVFRNPFRSQNENSDYANFMMQQQEAGAPTQFAAPDVAPEPTVTVAPYTVRDYRVPLSSDPNAANNAIFKRYGISFDQVNPAVQDTGGGGNNDGRSGGNNLAKAAVNAGLSYIIGPTYDYVNAGRQVLRGDIPGAASSLVSGLTGGVSNVLKKFRFEDGGPVKTHYQTAGAVKARHDYMSPEEEQDFNQRFREFNATQPEAVSAPVNVVVPPPPVIIEPQVAAPAPKSVLTEIAAKNIKAEPMPAAPAAAVAPMAVEPKPVVPFGDERLGNIQALLAAYGPKDTTYAADLTAARTAAKAESDAFAKMLKTAMDSPEDAQSSKAEMYFRLAAAFGAPTKTGQFSENLGMVGKELGEYAKGKRASAREKLALGLEAQKLKVASSKEDLNTLRALSAEEMKDKRAIATELIKDYIKSGEPQSAAGKQALDEGLKPGTPAYQKRVAEIGNLNVEGKMTQISAALANIGVAQASLNLRQNQFENQKQQQSKLTGPELKLKVEAEDNIASGKQSLADLKQAYALNPNSLAGGWLDKGQQFLSEAAGSKDPTIVNTRVLNNLLGSQGLAKLRATFGGSPTEGERSILLELEGIGAKTKDERGQIIKRAYKVLQDRQAREQSRLDQINLGAYRMTTPLEGGTD